MNSPLLCRTSITPLTLQSARGALAIYLEGREAQNFSKALFGLTLLRDASEEQINEAIRALASKGPMSEADVRASLASVSDEDRSRRSTPA